ncbi:ABC transporter ATP-binding protein [Marinovum sp. 2_MG-2023]|uniref:FliH/SctL family protein n=1 Tax=Roseobacteraceae TaxID=2854170 RepID=UPI001FCF7F72|nr:MULTISPECIES: ABC transporter ATP-binding protein [Roseobacteraceae]MCJ7871017.1 ABC transporter ATP-binding protein [Phaeobacter sp. J2-8]MDO6729771.1 ABC transporter ATP-binding protein [Marinovum sp. 2_MG-2023]MDO6779585.1 ABC transporter ATP-binding protein [Marinovum sp. 1_MG-2023]
MTIGHLLEDFGGTRAAATTPVLQDDEEIETRRLAAFEEGYQAGWDDAVQAHAKDKIRLTSDLAQNLLDLSFTYNEAYSHLLREMRPLLIEIIDKLLPEVMRRSIGPRIVEELQNAASENLACDAHILVHPGLVETVESLIEREDSFPVLIRGDVKMAEGQAQLSLADREIEINLDDVISEISAALDAFTLDLQKEDSHGRQHAV